MVHAVGAGRGPLPLPVAVAFVVVVGPLLLWFAYKSATQDPKPKILTCNRESANVIVCQPGNVRAFGLWSGVAFAVFMIGLGLHRLVKGRG